MTMFPEIIIIIILFWDAFNLKNFICSAVRMCVFDAVCLPARFFKICQVKFHETWLKRRALTKHV